MALCGFCRKLRFRPSDVIFMVLMCIALYFVYQYQFAEIKREHAQKNAARKEAFNALQKACLMGDESACQKAYGSTAKSTK